MSIRRKGACRLKSPSFPVNQAVACYLIVFSFLVLTDQGCLWVVKLLISLSLPPSPTPTFTSTLSLSLCTPVEHGCIHFSIQTRRKKNVSTLKVYDCQLLIPSPPPYCQGLNSEPHVCWEGVLLLNQTPRPHWGILDKCCTDEHFFYF